jgi:hypothetical protein
MVFPPIRWRLRLAPIVRFFLLLVTQKALGPEQLLMARFRPDGVLVPAGK